jgi:hypothetical protein
LLAVAAISNPLKAQTDRSIIYKDPDNKKIVRDKAFEQILIRAYYDNPMIYGFSAKNH